MGWAFYKLRRWRESVSASEAALQIDGTMTAVRYNLGLALLRLGETGRAREEYRQAMAQGDAAALKSAGIHDLEAALREEPNLPGGQETMNEMQRVYRKTAPRGAKTRPDFAARRRSVKVDG